MAMGGGIIQHHPALHAARHAHLRDGRHGDGPYGRIGCTARQHLAQHCIVRLHGHIAQFQCIQAGKALGGQQLGAAVLLVLMAIWDIRRAQHAQPGAGRLLHVIPRGQDIALLKTAGGFARGGSQDGVARGIHISLGADYAALQPTLYHDLSYAVRIRLRVGNFAAVDQLHARAQ